MAPEAVQSFLSLAIGFAAAGLVSAVYQAVTAQPAVGHRVSFDDHPKDDDWFTVVGVVGDVKDRPESVAAEPAFWWPLSQMPVGALNMVMGLRAIGLV